MLQEMNKIPEAQSHIDGILVAQMLMDFQREFNGIYPYELMVSHMMAVGPMQSFIGYAIQQGYLALPQNEEPK